MALAPRLDLRQSQTLVMTPQLQQAIKLLQLSNIELSAYVEGELEQNPLLERDEGPGPDAGDMTVAAPGDGEAPVASAADGGATEAADPVATETAAAVEGDGWNENDFDDDGERVDQTNWRQNSGRGDFEGDERSVAETVGRERSLREHLTEQLNVDLPDPADRVIGVQLLDSLDERGYLTGSVDDIATLLGCPAERVETVLQKVQRFDPPGIFARDLAECLALQLAERDRLDPAMMALLANLPLLAKRDVAALKRVCGVDDEDLQEMVAEIKALNPRPASVFDHEIAQPITPDILMRAQSNGGWLVELNAETLPRVLVNQRYYAKVHRDNLSKTDKEYLTERFQAANWLVKSLHQRATTILRVATEIVRQQDAFFRHGVSHLRPLILRDIAEAIEMHESTVSRVTTNKYMQTPRGLYELKYFFTSAIASSAGGEAHSAEAVRFRIKALIDAEAAQDILSDDRIVEILKGQGVDIARRTVAKYREAMRIPSSVQRKREKSLLSAS
ncbi:MAG: RNA polymerase factor sigma-54 [Rhodospirillales bacterium]|nr:RNA polymerase factor sigma-54 [Rhodospirillales bacterium]